MIETLLDLKKCVPVDFETCLDKVEQFNQQYRGIQEMVIELLTYMGPDQVGWNMLQVFPLRYGCGVDPEGKVYQITIRDSSQEDKPQKVVMGFVVDGNSENKAGYMFEPKLVDEVLFKERERKTASTLSKQKHFQQSRY